MNVSSVTPAALPAPREPKPQPPQGPSQPVTPAIYAARDGLTRELERFNEAAADVSTPDGQVARLVVNLEASAAAATADVRIIQRQRSLTRTLLDVIA
ncbi:MAG: hypothetical protein HY294_09855 [Candidatus Rokubacteria bacterium]|nr:hypothetical protein [Candidatus Rokubacteria bacterium]MBI3826289.1 hypothetical protein [Candidatus Rokubacteria bacterium]